MQGLLRLLVGGSFGSPNGRQFTALPAPVIGVARTPASATTQRARQGVQGGRAGDAVR